MLDNGAVNVIHPHQKEFVSLVHKGYKLAKSSDVTSSFIMLHLEVLFYNKFVHSPLHRPTSEGY